MKIKALMTPGTETKIVALLLLFFLAHLAFGEPLSCGLFKTPISYYCGFATPRNIASVGQVEHRLWWSSTPDAQSVCMSKDLGTRGTFDYKFAKYFHVRGNQLIPYHLGLTESFRETESGDIVVGIRLMAVPADIFGIKYKARIFIHHLEPKDQGAVTYTSYAYKDFSEAPAVEIENTSGASSVTLKDGTSLACGFQIGNLPAGS